MVDCQLYGLHAGGHHVTNAILHALTAALLFLVLRQMTGHSWPIALAAGLFAIHPLRVESVAWVTERKDVLSGLFFMLTLAAYVRYVRRPFSLGRYLLVVVLFVLGLMAKPSLVTLPFLLLLLDYWPLGRFAANSCQSSMPPHARDGLDPTPRHCHGGAFFAGTDVSRATRRWLRSNRRLFLEKVPLMLLVAVACALAVWGQGHEAFSANEHYPLWWRIENGLISYVTYLGQYVCPLGLAVPYLRPGLDLPIWRVCGASSFCWASRWRLASRGGGIRIC